MNLQENAWIYMNRFVFKDEYGKSQPIRFASAKAYDSKGKEIITPQCLKCGSHKIELIGKNSNAWICQTCGN